ncbi:hypothetical protein D3C73_1183030 [compost metagenome]
MVRQQDRAEFQRLRQLPDYSPGPPRAIRPACLRHAAYQPGRRAAVQGRPMGAVGARRVQLRRRPLHRHAGPALRPLRTKAAVHRQLRQQSQRGCAAAVQQRQPLLAQAAGHVEGHGRTERLRAVRLRLQGAQRQPALHQLWRPRHLSARGQSVPETRNQQGLGTGRQDGLRRAGRCGIVL